MAAATATACISVTDPYLCQHKYIYIEMHCISCIDVAATLLITLYRRLYNVLLYRLLLLITASFDAAIFLSP